MDRYTVLLGNHNKANKSVHLQYRINCFPGDFYTCLVEFMTMEHAGREGHLHTSLHFPSPEQRQCPLTGLGWNLLMTLSSFTTLGDHLRLPGCCHITNGKCSQTWQDHSYSPFPFIANILESLPLLTSPFPLSYKGLRCGFDCQPATATQPSPYHNGHLAAGALYTFFLEDFFS